ncbi:hypothetical protein ACWDWS_39915 [Streptomyces sp. NPDC003328]|uniref:hypothetical protein n=1 Tax=unclassified Streptomyces TaxID=2593676 RepID=UPI00362E54AC
MEGLVAVGRAARRAERTARVEAAVGKDAAPAALDLLELVEFAWHDCYGDVTPDEDVVEDILTCSQGDLARMIRFARLAVEDWRDLRMAADEIRPIRNGPGADGLTC